MEGTGYASDQQLISGLQHGNAETFASIVQLYTGDLLRHAFHRLKNEHDAEDMVQDIFSELWEKRDRITINTSLSGYLFTTLKHRTLRHISRTNLHARAVEHLLIRMDEMQAGILELLTAKEMDVTLKEAIADLPENMRNIFVLRQEDFTIKEIALALGLAEQTVKNYNVELLKRLKKVVAQKHPDINHSFIYLLVYLLTKD